MSAPTAAQFLILGGPPRSASTALFHHLAAHPRICPSERKETGALLDPDYILWTADGITTAGRSTVRPLGEYFRLYPGWPDPRFTYMEGSTDYLYSAGTPRRIRALGDSKVVFILREPIARVVSMYWFALRRGWLEKRLSLDEYVRHQLSLSSPREGPPPLLTVPRGRYTPWIRAYFEVFDRECVHVAFFEELIGDPAAAVAEICRFAGLDPAPLAGLPFGRRNDSYAVRSPGLQRWIEATRARAPRLARCFPGAKRVMRRVWRAAEPAYRRINARPPTPLSPSLRNALESYYLEDRESLEGLLGRPVPWKPPGGDTGATTQ